MNQATPWLFSELRMRKAEEFVIIGIATTQTTVGVGPWTEASDSGVVDKEKDCILGVYTKSYSPE